jgi:23S rRNA (cytosine1962-C5)-methyltransferase
MAYEPIRVAWPTERLIHVDDQVLVVDKPRGLPVHGGSPEFDDIVTRLARFLRERGEPDYLAVHSRLDKDVSGVLLFGREPGNNQAIAREFESRRITKRYLAVVRDSALPARFEMNDRLLPTERGRTRVVESGGVEAVTEVSVRARQRGRALVELCPKTGRRHQLRAQLAHRGAPICGDLLYRGDAARRLMLHAVHLESMALGWHFDSEPPECFADFGLSGELGTRDGLARVLFEAAWLREPLFRTTEVLRLVNSAGDGVPGVAIDRYGDWAVLELSSDEAMARRREVGELTLALGARGVYTKCRMRRDLRQVSEPKLASSEPDGGESAPEALVVRENGLPIEVRLSDGWDVGIYLDQRENRRRVMAAAKGRAVLNLFGYTAAFSLAAAVGGAAHTTTVDISGRALERGRRNFELAGVAPSAEHQFFRADAVEWLRRAVRTERRFDLVILDPPTFSTVGRGRVFRLADRWDSLLSDAMQLLNPHGQMLVVSHERASGRHELRQRIQRAAERQGKTEPRIRDLASAVDVPDGPEGPWPSYALWVELP